MHKRIINAAIVLPDREVSQGVLNISAEKIVSVDSFSFREDIGGNACAEIETFDFAGDLIIPGLIDTHVHGSCGADTMDGTARSLEKMSSALLKQGTVAFLPTTMAASGDRLSDIMRAEAKMQPGAGRAEIVGFHLEGPCISARFLGAQNIIEATDVPVPLGVRVKMMTLAPELPEASELIHDALAAGIIVSVGHSGAGYEDMLKFIDQGIRHITHAFNAMPGIHHRTPGLLTAALLDPRVHLELIADGVHIHPAVLELALRLKGTDRILLVSDGTRAVGMPEGDYELGGRQVSLKGGRMILPDGTLAGSASTLLDGVRFMARVVGRTLCESVRMAALNPARLLGLSGRLGSLEPGREATFLRLSPDLSLKEVWVRGRLLDAPQTGSN